MPVTKKCKYCGKEFKTRPSIINKRIYCSRSCSAKAKTGKDAHNWRGGNIKRECGFCGKEFFVKRHKVRDGKGFYCSVDCRDKARTGGLIKCKHCGKQFHVTRARIPKAKYCSRECHYADREGGVNHFNFGSIITKCHTCGKEYYTHPCKIKKYCSRKCRLQGRAKSLASSPNSLEKMLVDELDRRNIYYVFQYPFGNWIIDFAFIGAELAVEVDGEYWHNIAVVKARDKRKNKYIEECGWNILRISESDIHNDVSKCVDTIVHLLNS